MIRVPESALLIDLMTALGAVPVPLAFDKVYSALETGQIDGAENNWPSYDSMRHNEVAPYFVVDEHMRIPELQMMSRSTWDILPEEYQKVIVECARLSANYERSVWKERVDISRKRVIEEGCQEFLISDEEKQKFLQPWLRFMKNIVATRWICYRRSGTCSDQVVVFYKRCGSCDAWTVTS